MCDAYAYSIKEVRLTLMKAAVGRDSESSEDSEAGQQSIQLGFAEPGRRKKLFHDPDWCEWDGGIIGGKPVR